MKQFLLLSLIFLALKSPAAVITVSNNPSSPAEYDDLQTAFNDMDAGDTIILSGSRVSYGSVTANRSMVLLGPGWSPESGDSARIEALTLQGAADNTVIAGIDFSRIKAEGSFDNVVVYNCRFNYTGYAIDMPDHDNWQIYGNYFSGGYIDLDADSQHNLITNNVFRLLSGSGVLRYAGNTTLLLNNIIYSPNNYAMFSSSSGVFIANNIFIMSNSTQSADPNSGCSECNFNNNISFSTYGIDVPDMPGKSGYAGSNFGGNNWDDTDPEFLSLPNDAADFSRDHDYRLAGNSPGKNAGSDATDVGIYGRGFEFNDRGYTDLPRIYYMNVENPVVLVDSSLHVVVKSTTTK